MAEGVEAMNEYALIGWAFLDVLVVAVAAALYSVGGRSNKWIRRFVSPAVLVAYCAGIARGDGRPFWWVALASYPLYAAAYSLGYGVKSKLTKWFSNPVVVRSITASAYVFACIGIVVAFGAFKVSTLAFCVWMVPLTVFLTTWNPFPAAMEEFLVCFMTTVFVPFFMYAAR